MATEPKACSGLTLHFDKLSVLSSSTEAALLYLAIKGRGLPLTRAEAEGALPNGSSSQDLYFIGRKAIE